MLKKTSLKDIAQAVGVSTTLVSYVLNHQNEHRISKAVAQRIRETAQLLNYQPNQIARSLKTNKSFTLGWWWPISPIRSLLRWPASSKIRPINSTTPFCLAVPTKRPTKPRN